MTEISFQEKANKWWTPERELKVTGGKSLLFKPARDAELLGQIGILNSDASMSADAIRKYLQINHMIAIVLPQLEELKKRHATVHILDCGCGNSYLTFLLAWLFARIWNHPVAVTGVDSNQKLIDQCKNRATLLNLNDVLNFYSETVQQAALRLAGERIHAVVSLHACDTATDDALGIGLNLQADLILAAPCCQAELAAAWKNLPKENQHSALKVMIQSPELRRSSAATFTDALRVLLLRGTGYEVTSTEFVPSQHTPKNRLIVAERRGQYLDSALTEYLELKKLLGAKALSLEEKLPERIKQKIAVG